MTPQKPNLAVSQSITDEHVVFPVFASPKLDGIRTTVWPEQPLTRSMKPIPNQYIRELIQEAKLPAVFDGELIVGDPCAPDVFNASTSGVMSRDGLPDFGFYVFDFVPQTGTMGSFVVPPLPFRDRAHKLASNTSAICAFNPWFKVLEQRLIHNLDELRAYEQEQLLLGYEGTMLCGPDSLYKHGRSTLREYGKMKRKPFVDAEALVIGYEEQMQNTNEQVVNELGNLKRSSHLAGMVGKNTLGALICQNPDGSTFRLGTGKGLTHELRAQLWAERDTLPGRIARFKKQLVGEKDKPRIPVWTGFRDPRDMS
jgi:DNA ligase-1